MVKQKVIAEHLFQALKRGKTVFLSLRFALAVATIRTEDFGKAVKRAEQKGRDDG